MDWIVPGLLAVLLVAEILAMGRRSALARRMRALETRVTEIGNQLSEEVAEKVSVESAALKEEVVTRLMSLETCAERMGSVEERIEAAVRNPPEAADPERVAALVRPIIQEAVEALDGRLRHVSETIREVKEETVEEAVKRALSARGFTDVQMAGSPSLEGGRTRLSVEARRDGMSFKGPVFLVGTRVVEQRLSPSYPMFP